MWLDLSEKHMNHSRLGLAFTVSGKKLETMIKLQIERDKSKLPLRKRSSSKNKKSLALRVYQICKPNSQVGVYQLSYTAYIRLQLCPILRAHSTVNSTDPMSKTAMSLTLPSHFIQRVLSSTSSCRSLWAPMARVPRSRPQSIRTAFFSGTTFMVLSSQCHSRHKTQRSKE